jgi:hypothetical protein
VAIEPDGKDWTWVLERACPDCGFDPAGVRRGDVPNRIRRSADDWTAVLTRPDAARRPNEHTWSPLEYGCHLRDVHRIMTERLQLMLREQPAHFANWDQDATAVELDYGGQHPGTVAAELAAAAENFATAYAGVTGTQWDRAGLRSNGSAFTVESFAGYALHDLEHHRVDVGLPAREDWSTPAGLKAIAAEHRRRIPGWRDPSGFAVGVRPTPDGDPTFGLVNGPAAGASLTAVLLAEVLGHTGGEAVYELDRPTLDAAIASLARAEATVELGHPNLAAWREIAAANPAQVVAVFLDEPQPDGAGAHPDHRALLADPRLSS